MPAAVGRADRAAARRRFAIEAEERCLLVFGGSQGARSINLAALDAFVGDGTEAERVPCAAYQRRPRLPPGPRPDRGGGPGRALHAGRVRGRPRRRPRRLRPRAGARPVARSSRSPPPGGRRSSSRTRTRPDATSTRTPSGWPRPGRRTYSRTPSSIRPRLRALAATLRGDPVRLAQMAARLGGARPTRCRGPGRRRAFRLNSPTFLIVNAGELSGRQTPASSRSGAPG